MKFRKTVSIEGRYFPSVDGLYWSMLCSLGKPVCLVCVKEIQADAMFLLYVTFSPDGELITDREAFALYLIIWGDRVAHWFKCSLVTPEALALYE